MKSLRSTLVLLLIVAAVGGYIYFNERGPVAESGNAVLLRTDASRVNSISLGQPGKTSIELLQHNGQWQLKQGKSPALPADPDAIKSLLDQVQLVQSPSVLPETPDKLKEYGLDKPRNILKIDGNTISFGNKPLFDATRVYALVQSNGSRQVGLVASALSDVAAKPASDWRDKVILRIKVEDATRVQVQAPAIKAMFERDNETADGGEESWKITQPVQALAGGGIVRSFLEQLPQTKTSRFLEDAPKSLVRWGLHKPQATVEVLSGDTKKVLRIGRKTSSGYAAQNSDSTSVFEVPVSIFALANRPLREWRSKQLLSFEIDKLTQLEISTRGKTLEFHYKRDKWGLKTGNSPADAQAQHQAVLDVLLAAQGLSAQEFIDRPQSLATYGLGDPTLQLKLFSLQWSGAKTVSLAAKNGKIYGHVMSSDGTDNTVYVLMSSTLAAFKPSLDILLPPNKPAPPRKPKDD